MVLVNISGPDGQIIESVDLSQQPTYNDPECEHPANRVKEVEDDSGMTAVKAYQCQACKVGWIVKIKES